MNNKIYLLNFNYIFSTISRKFLDDCFDYKLINDNKLNINLDCKKILFHHTIFEICEELIKNHINAQRVLYISLLDKNNEVFEYCNYDDFSKVYKTFLKKLSKCLPVIIYISDTIDPFELVIDNGVEIELSNIIMNKIYKYENTNMSFEKIKGMCKKYELVFLNEEYFNKLRSKKILY